MNTSPQTTLNTARTAEKSGALSRRQQKLLSDHYPLVERVVLSMRTQLAAHADLEELQSVGLTGLVRAVRNYDDHREESFRGYAVLRIRGAILDELRRMDWMTRTSRRKLKDLQETVGTLEQELGRAPREEEVRRRMRLSRRDFHRLQRQTESMSFVSLDSEVATQQDGQGMSLHEQIADDSQKAGYEDMETGELLETLVAEMEGLPDRQRKVLAFYYHEKLKLSEIAEVFGVTEARICQIHGQAIRALKTALVKCEALASV